MPDWKHQYEDAAAAEQASYARLPLAELLRQIRLGETGDYSTVWDVVAERGAPAQVGWALYDFLTSHRPYLDRYHCAAALLRVMRCTEFQAVDLSANSPGLAQNLSRLGQILEAAVGKPGPEFPPS